MVEAQQQSTSIIDKAPTTIDYGVELDDARKSLESLKNVIELTPAERETIKTLPDYNPNASREEQKAREAYFTKMKNDLLAEVETQGDKSPLSQALQEIEKNTDENGNIIAPANVVRTKGKSDFDRLIIYLGNKHALKLDAVACSAIDIGIWLHHDPKASGRLVALWEDHLTLNGSYTGYKRIIAEKDITPPNKKSGSQNSSNSTSSQDKYAELDDHKENKREINKTRITTPAATTVAPLNLEEWEEKYSDKYYDKEKVNKVLSLVRSRMGTPYLLGGRSPGRGIDCSGMIIVALQRLGLKDIGGASGPMFNKTKDLTINEQGYRSNNDLLKDEKKVLPGSLIFWQATVKPNKYNSHGNMVHHVAIVSNPPFIDGKLNIIESRGGTGVIENTINLDRIADKSNHQSTIHIHNNPALQA